VAKLSLIPTMRQGGGAILWGNQSTLHRVMGVQLLFDRIVYRRVARPSRGFCQQCILLLHSIDPATRTGQSNLIRLSGVHKVQDRH